jgi:hypothetical protein
LAERTTTLPAAGGGGHLTSWMIFFALTLVWSSFLVNGGCDYG